MIFQKSNDFRRRLVDSELQVIGSLVCFPFLVTLRSGKDDGPGFVCPVVNPSSHAQTWATGERKSWLDADPDEPPGPGVGQCLK